MKYTDIPEAIRTKMEVDTLIFGTSFCLMKNGKYERIDPIKVVLQGDGTYKMIDGETFSHRTTANVRFRFIRKIFIQITKATSYIRERWCKLARET